jgi:uncharacterized protein (DUF1778 family)
MKSPQTGRPKSADAKNTTIEFRLSDLEKQAFQDAADLAGIGLSTWVRERLRRSAIKELEDAARPIAFIQEIHLR